MIELFHPEPTKEEMVQATEAVFDSGKLARGEQIETFERTLASSVDMDHAIALSSGTTALHTAVRAMGWDKGDKILTSPYSFIATSNALLYEDCEPVFGKVSDNLQLDLGHARKILDEDPDIKGILIPNVFGHESDLEGLKKIRKELPHIGIVEDASQALATGDYGLGVGRFSDIVTYSFHENKIVTTFGEGGAIATNNEELAERIRSLRQHGRLDAPDWLGKVGLGYNYRLSEIQAALGTLQLQRLPEIVERRRQLAQVMSDELTESGLELPNQTLRSWFGFYVVAASQNDAQSLTEELLSQDVQSRSCPMPALTEFAHNKSYTSHDSKITERAQNVVMLPLHTRLSEDDVDKVVESVKSWTSRNIGKTVLSSVQFYDRLAEQYGTVKEERSGYIKAINSLVIQAIERNKNGLFPENILDIGCGDGKRGLEIARAVGCKLESVDSSPFMVNQASKNGVNARTLDIQDLKSDQEYDTILMLWNVLGHVDGNRTTALKNVCSALSQNGLLAIDVNNLLNAAQYGTENAQRNALAIANNLSGSGDFVAERTVSGSKISTSTHIFHKQEIIGLLESAGFEIDQLSFVNYSDGSITDESDGQIFIVARKRNS